MDWSGFCEEMGGRLYRYFYAVAPEEVVADMVQETLLRVYKDHCGGKFDPSLGNLAMYSFGVARNLKKECRRKIAVELGRFGAGALSEDLAGGGDLAMEERVLRFQLKKLIRQLSEIEEELLLLYMDQQLKVTEIADHVGMPLGTVKSHLHRAKEKLKGHLQQDKGVYRDDKRHESRQ